jgi:hypothetical protein
VDPGIGELPERGVLFQIGVPDAGGGLVAGAVDVAEGVGSGGGVVAEVDCE